MFTKVRVSTLAALAAGAALVATPAAALDLPQPASPHRSVSGLELEQAGWGRQRHRDNGISTGDVLAGVLVIGAIAAIAGAASNDARDDRRYPDPVREPARGNYPASSGLDRAVEMCVDEVERGRQRVDTVDDATRDARGWRVAGVLDNGAPWDCRIDNDGRIREVSLPQTQGYDAYSTADSARYDGQLSDDTYARARAAQRYSGSAAASERYTYPSTEAPNPGYAAPDYSAQPAYPGGPLPGEEGYEEAMRNRAGQ